MFTNVSTKKETFALRFLFFRRFAFFADIFSNKTLENMRMSKKVAPFIAAALFVAALSSTSTSCTQETLAFEGNWILVDTLANKSVNQTILHISSNNFSIQYNQKSDTAKNYNTFAVQKGLITKYAEFLTLDIKEFGYLPKDTSKTLKIISRKDSLFAKNIDSLLTRTSNSLNILIKDSTEKYRYEVSNSRLFLKQGTINMAFKKE